MDGVDLSTVRLDSYRTRLGVVLQESFLFDGTIRENVAFSRPDASEEDILRACRIARVDEFAESFADKYDTVVGERGVKALRRTAAANFDCPRHSGGAAHPDSRRGHFQPRLGIGANDPARSFLPDAGTHHVRDRAPAFDHPPRRSDPGRSSRGRSSSTAPTKNSTPCAAAITISIPSSMASRAIYFWLPARAMPCRSGGRWTIATGQAMAMPELPTLLRLVRGEIR